MLLYIIPVDVEADVGVFGGVVSGDVICLGVGGVVGG